MTAKQIGKFSSGNAAYALFYPEKDSSQSANFSPFKQSGYLVCFIST